MQDTATNRQIVQKGLDRRAARRRDAEIECQAQELRRTINLRAARQWEAEQKAQEQAATITHDREKERAMIQKERAKIRRERAAESALCFAWYSFILRVFTPMLIGAATLGLANRGLLPYGLAVPGAIIACLLSVEAFVSRFIPRLQKPIIKIRKGEM